jgi:hypothetical protein
MRRRYRNRKRENNERRSSRLQMIRQGIFMSAASVTAMRSKRMRKRLRLCSQATGSMRPVHTGVTTGGDSFNLLTLNL